MSRNRPNKAYIAELGLFFSICFEKHIEKEKNILTFLRNTNIMNIPLFECVKDKMGGNYECYIISYARNNGG